MKSRYFYLLFIFICNANLVYADEKKEFTPKKPGVEMEGTDQQKNLEFVSKVYMQDMTDITCVYETKLYTTGAIIYPKKGVKLECVTEKTVTGDKSSKWAPVN